MIIDAYSNKNPHNLYICQTTGKGKTGGGERYQQHKRTLSDRSTKRR